MGKKIYVGNLPFSTTGESLSEIFAQFGQVSSSKIVKDRDSGRSKGFGFVEMASGEEADKAIQRLHGSDYSGRALTVNEARPMIQKAPGHFGNNGQRDSNSRPWS